MHGRANVPLLSWSVISVGILKSVLNTQKTSQLGLSSHMISFICSVAVSRIALRTRNKEFGIRYSASECGELSICEVDRNSFSSKVLYVLEVANILS